MSEDDEVAVKFTQVAIVAAFTGAIAAMSGAVILAQHHKLLSVLLIVVGVFLGAGAEGLKMIRRDIIADSGGGEGEQ